MCMQTYLGIYTDSSLPADKCYAYTKRLATLFSVMQTSAGDHSLHVFFLPTPPPPCLQTGQGVQSQIPDTAHVLSTCHEQHMSCIHLCIK